MRTDNQEGVSTSTELKRPARREVIDRLPARVSGYHYYAADGSWLASSTIPIPEWDAMIEKDQCETEPNS